MASPSDPGRASCDPGPAPGGSVVSHPTWTVLGAGSALPRVGYGPAAYALRPAPGAGVTLFDCGPGTVRSLAAARIRLDEIERLVLSHFHADHFLDAFALAFARHNPALEAAPHLELIGPRGLARRLEAVADALGRSVAFDDATVIEVDATPEPRACPRPGLGLASVRTRHTETSLAWRAEVQGVSVTYTGDSCDVPEVAALATDTDLFVVECSFPDGQGTPNHLTPSSAADLARRACAKKLLLTHFYPSLDPDEARRVARRSFAGPIELAQDGLVLDVAPRATSGRLPE